MKLPNWVRKQLKKKSRIYIMPTKMGGYLNGLVFLMFLLSIGYSNNLLLIFTLVLFGFNLIWVIQTHFHLHAFKLDNVIIQDAHAGEKAMVKVFLKKVPLGPCKWELDLEENETHFLFVNDTTDQWLIGHVVFPKRGLIGISHIKVKTQMPFGLYVAWIYLPVQVKAYVYPARLPDAELLTFEHSSLNGEDSTLQAGPHDVWNLGPYQGEEARKINWKHYARSGDLVIKEGVGPVQSLMKFKFNGNEFNKEYLLSKISTQMLQCSKSDIPFSLDTPHNRFPSGQSTKHLSDCLRELSQC